METLFGLALSTIDTAIVEDESAVYMAQTMRTSLALGSVYGPHRRSAKRPRAHHQEAEGAI